MGQIDVATLAEQYLTGEPVEPTAQEIQDFNSWVNSRFDLIARYVQFTPDEVSPEQAKYYWEHYAILLISTAHNSHPYWEGGVNARFRAIHDWDHIHGAFSFNLAGELCAAGYAMSTAPESIRWILWSEVALQAAAAIHTGEFQEQKLVRV